MVRMNHWLLLLSFAMATLVQASDDFEGDYDTKSWQEIEVKLPAAPKSGNLLPIYVSAATSNQFFVDGASLSVGADGVVRYVMVIRSAAGAQNVSFEGMRCETRERRIYASGRQDGTWSKARNNEWVRIQDVYGNRHHAALFLEYFCPFGNIVLDATEARRALQQGGHPDTSTRTTIR